MIVFISAILLVLLALLALVLEKTYFCLPPKELRRQIAAGDEVARSLFTATAYGAELKLLLWLIFMLSAAGGFLLFARLAPPELGLVLVVITLWLAFLWLPRRHLSSFTLRLTVRCTPTVVWLLHALHPVNQYLVFLTGPWPVSLHTGLYEGEDILELLDRQKEQEDNRLSDGELSLMRHALQFHNYHVKDVMVPRKQAIAVSLDDDVGPVLLDELHKTGHDQFPVYQGKSTNILGTLSLDDVTDLTRHGKVQDFYKPHLVYVHEHDSLEQALRAFYETRQHLFIVVNSANQYIGIVTLADILRQLTGAIDHEAFGQHDNRQVVATRHMPQPVEVNSAVTTERLTDDTSEMVE